MPQDFISSETMVEEIDAEVKRVSELFQFILKYREQFQASGIEFSDLREYTSGDDSSRIDWKSSARLPELYVKEYEEEQDMDVFIVLDVSDTMNFGTADKLKSEYTAVLASTIAYASVDAGTNVGIGMFGEEETFLSPDGGERQYQKILREVSNHENYGGEFDFSYALEQVLKRVKEKTFIFVISDFIDFGKGDWEPKLRIMNKKYRNVFTMMVRDLRDYSLPDSGNVRFEKPSGGQKMIFNTHRFSEEFGELVEEQESEISEKIAASGSEFLKIDTRDSFAAELMKYFDRKGGAW